MTRMRVFSAVARAAGLIGSSVVSFAQTTGPTPERTPATQQHLDKAKQLAAHDEALKNSIALLCTQIASNGPDLATKKSQATPTPPPTKAFDNLYYVGIGSVGSWALNTNAGIILFDTLNNAAEAEQYIDGGLRALKLDPANIKYIVITHGHADHYGGASYFQSKFPNARIMMSAGDYELAEKTAATRPGAVPAPKRDMVVTDGQKLTLGDTTITLHVNPGHTPGSISTILPAKIGGRTHLISFWGGTTPPRLDRAMLVKYSNSFKAFMKAVNASGAEGLISNHPVWDGGSEKLAAIRANPNGANPYLIGKEQMNRYAAVQTECIAAGLTQKFPK